MCHHCPLQRQCAQDALAAGDTLDGEYRAIATSVIQAGVWLTGNKKPTAQLHAIAGCAPLEPRKRKPTPGVCLSCGQAMVPRDKSISLDASIVTHAARGYCRVCYARLKREGKLATLHPKHQAALGWREKHQKRA